MSKLAEFVERDYKLELEVIKDAGNNLWAVGLGISFFLAFLCGCDYLFGRPWDSKEFAFAILGVFVGPFINRAWERHEVAARMQHEREVRIEVKLDALLGLINVKDE
jgi:hypothetical protein